ncbi:helix-turn-helix domain-containing protein [Mucilaginibacter endophyticus]|uniref:helix-turn-helix domain-containing protein n=1 Tax=Mucilaginibacter endophyticus TaxID=2675003 RepID=UPI000E0DFFEE|nr:helix-turn-helix transcriptional regulator [Mucilaginibacter endophyticus]
MKETQDNTRAITNYIRTLRERKDYTQNYLAAKLSISQNAYSKLELGYSTLSVQRLFDIANILEIDIAELIDSGITPKKTVDNSLIPELTLLY